MGSCDHMIGEIFRALAFQALLLFIPFAIVLAFLFCISIFVYNDAKKREVPNEIIWAIGTFFAWFPVLIIYLATRDSLSKQNKSENIQ